jgi:hypothetical protein
MLTASLGDTRPASDNEEATMNKILTGALAALTMGGALAASTVPASAEPRGGHHGGGHYGGHYYGGGYRDHHRGDYGSAVGAGLIGLALGAALTNGYGYGYGPPAYYAPGYYYGPPLPRCRVEMRWNPVWGGYDRVRVCY